MRVYRPREIPAAVLAAERPEDPVEGRRFDRELRKWAAVHGFALTEVVGERRRWREYPRWRRRS